MMPLFKILRDGQPCHGGVGEYPPKGRWTPRRNPLICVSGWHLTSDPLRWWVPKADLWLAEGRGRLSSENTDKAAFVQIRLIERITRKWKYLPMFPRIRAFLAASARSRNANAGIKWAHLPGANLSNAMLRQADLSAADLGGVNLSGADLARANLAHACLKFANLFGADLQDAILSSASLADAYLIKANLTDANLTKACLAYASFDGATLGRANLTGADLSHADLAHVFLGEAHLARANLTGAYRPTDPPPGWIVDESGYLRPADAQKAKP